MFFMHQKPDKNEQGQKKNKNRRSIQMAQKAPRNSFLSI